MLRWQTRPLYLDVRKHLDLPNSDLVRQRTPLKLHQQVDLVLRYHLRSVTSVSEWRVAALLEQHTLLIFGKPMCDGVAVCEVLEG